MATESTTLDHVVHIADIHFWQIVRNPFHLMNKRFWGNLTVILRRSREFHQESAEPFADAVAATGARSVLLTGDFSSTSTDREFEMAVRFVRGLRDRGMAVFLVPGNHDVYTFGSARRKRFERHFGEFLPSQGYPARTALPGGTPLLLVPTVYPRHFSASGLITPDQIDRTRELLLTCQPPVIVAAHYPILSETKGYSSHLLRRLRNAELLHEAIGGAGKRVLYVAGHVHRFSVTADQKYPKMTHLTTGGFFRAVEETGSLGEFSEIRVLSDGFQIFRNQNLGDWKKTDTH